MVDRLVNSEANTRRIAFVEQCFGSSGQPLVVPGRVLVGEGVLTKLCRKKQKPRQFFLFNDALVYGNIILHKKKYNKQHILDLENVKLEDIPDEGLLRNGWKIISPSKSFAVFAATNTEKKEWMAHIRKCVSDLLIKKGTTQSSDNDSPVWVPDDDATTCMHCKASEFSVLKRKHHCRKCGIVACNSCTSKRWLLPLQSSKPLRVCLTCYNQLSNTNNAGGKTRKYTPIEIPDSSGDDSSDDDSTMPSAPYSEDNTYEGQFQSYEEEGPDYKSGDTHQ
ncbi:hypothetical protein LOTGIDRAFT_233364 [Lottia gigantea]|uniref:FYVE-type domain-containing protein n=1 Tax=Lottia gigantea TaxID=225164 RepID=V3ZJU0_LOTGI|nr:hypothetical protein LOTGIDRAFT_233364 [Lottia gigantea]ESO91553.1 hypothetical protein LOTGIDRAFT_233364 [Lottia gigantea]